MEDADIKFPYRCLPLVIANQYGWEILSTHHVRASWDGTSKPEGLYVESLYGDGRLYCHSHFGEGVLTFQIPFLFKTPDSWNLMVRGPTNSPKDGIIALDGIIETDWAHSTFTMNWRFTRACTVEFALGEPICLFFPIQPGVLEMFRGEFRMLETDRELENKFREWSASRDRFLVGLEKGKPEVVAEGWQKDYTRAAKQKRPLAHPFTNATSWTQPGRISANHDDSADMQVGSSNMSRCSHAYYRRAATTFHKRRYLLVKGILPRIILDYLQVYYSILLANDKFVNDSQCPLSLSLSGDPALDAVLEWIRPEVARLVGFDVAPTYSYMRRYAKGEVLKRHTDRAACEISVTASVQIPKGAPPSTFYLKPPNLSDARIEMQEGDGCVYAGTEVEHWRKRFRIDGYIQLFLHYVAKNGPNYPKLMFDERECLGGLQKAAP